MADLQAAMLFLVNVNPRIVMLGFKWLNVKYIKVIFNLMYNGRIFSQVLLWTVL